MFYSMYESEVDYVDIKRVEMKLDEIMTQCSFIQQQYNIMINKEINQVYMRQKRVLESIQVNIITFENQLIIGDV